ncbi:MAG TPA: flagellar hook-basal body complex protein FliE [Nevskia sp.]|nr:flagellar hook-basal body complex protein FliE [Nevskia sp.]
MSEIGVNSVLAQIRALSAQASQQPHKSTAAAPADGAGFGALIKDAIGQVNQSQGEAALKQRAFELGDTNTDLSSVMLATTKAQVSFRAMVEVRNRVISAYQDIMNMPL